MDSIEIHSVTRADVHLLHEALQQLSVALGDCQVANLAALQEAGFGSHPAYRALLALMDGQPVGALVYSALFSSTRGGGGLYVSDLWVAARLRRRGLGQRLLAHAVAQAQITWGVRFVKLAVYDDNPQAQRFYERLGFSTQNTETSMILDGPALDSLKGMT